jgi:hypothetical protein
MNKERNTSFEHWGFTSEYEGEIFKSVSNDTQLVGYLVIKGCIVPTLWDIDSGEVLKPTKSVENLSIAPIKPKWYNNIPKEGVICWVSDMTEEPSRDSSAVDVIYEYRGDEGMYKFKGEDNWAYAVPVKPSECLQEDE